MKNSGNITQNTTQYLYSYLANKRRIPLFRDLELGCSSPAEICTVHCEQSTRAIVWRPRLLKQPVAVGGPHKERTLPPAEGSPKMFWVIALLQVNLTLLPFCLLSVTKLLHTTKTKSFVSHSPSGCTAKIERKPGVVQEYKSFRFKIYL
jgi:hypothetical protein